MKMLQFVITAVLVAHACMGIRITDVHLPQYIVKGGEVTMSCRYDREGVEIYVIKWYKDKQEFYHFLPRSTRQKTTYDVPGFHVKVDRSSRTDVTLGGIDYRAAGTYRCEVSGEAPSFWTVFKEQNISVVALPEGRPRISSSRFVFTPGDTISVNCSSRTRVPALQANHARHCISNDVVGTVQGTLNCTAPDVTAAAADINWFLNGEQVSRDNIRHWRSLKPSDVTNDVGTPAADDVITATGNLHLLVRRHHFKNGVITLKCAASIGSVYWDSTELRLYSPERHSAERRHMSNAASQPGRLWRAAPHIAAVAVVAMQLIVGLLH